MSPSRFLTVLLLVVLALAALSGPVAAQGPQPAGQGPQPAAPDAPFSAAFSYQGSLSSNGAPANGTFDFQFILYNAASGGGQVGATVALEDVAVNNGIFTVELDFGAAAFDGQARWLSVGVRPGASTGAYSILSPRHALTAVPYAVYATKAPWAGLQSMPAGFADGVDNDTTYSAGAGLTLTLTGTTFAADAAYLQRRVSGTSAAGSAIRQVNSDGTVTCEADDMGWSLTGNAGTTPGTHFLGTTDNQALELKVNGQRVLRLEPNATSPNAIGGLSGNWLTSGVYGATIGGGGHSGVLNHVTDAYGTVGGGAGNRAGNNAGAVDDATAATVGGGWSNAAGGRYATVAGGDSNSAAGSHATVAGGESNSAAGSHATVAGGEGNSVAASYAAVAGGIGNIASGDHATIGGGRSNTASGTTAIVGGGVVNTASGYAATASGGDFNTASGYIATVSGGYSNIASGYIATVSGGYSNTVSGYIATVSGGYSNTVSGIAATASGGYSNTVRGSYATVGGGAKNTASHDYATVAGGYSSTARGAYATVGGGGSTNASGDYATVGGGYNNYAGKVGATVGGGAQNAADGAFATVPGGARNTASGYYATVSGGEYNTASGDYSFAAGRRAKANAQGSFVWADSTNSDLVSAATNQFLVRSTNGVYFYTNAALTSGVRLPAGDSAWSPVSDRNLKENFAVVNSRDLLDRLAQVPVTTWNYKSQDASIRHIGPVAQDFYAAFGVGEDDTHISTIDPDGVALAAIQGLYQVVQEQESRIAAQEAQISALKAQHAAIEARLAALERQAAVSGQSTLTGGGQ